MSAIINTLLLVALPASGKSEIRKVLELLSKEARMQMHLGPTVQLDDYPYVNFIKRIDQELRKLDHEPIFYGADHLPFLEMGTWLMLTALLNEDYARLMSGYVSETDSVALDLMARIDTARLAVGMQPVLLDVDGLGLDVCRQIAEPLEPDARKIFDNLNRINSEGADGKTVVIEFARGGPEGCVWPIEGDPYHGYDASFGVLSDQILSDPGLGIMYVQVTPEQSWERNCDRAQPGPEGDASNLFHGVPWEVIRTQYYGGDDFEYLLACGDGNHVQIGDKMVPATIVDNRGDMTSFVRLPRGQWPEDKLQSLVLTLREGMREIIREISRVECLELRQRA